MGEAFRITISRSDEINEIEGREINDINQLSFNDPEDDIEWENPEWFVFGKQAERIVSIVGVLRRRIRVGEISLEIGGIGGVVTHPDYRKRGYSSALLQRAADFMRDDLQVEFGVLFCADEKINFYGTLGWQIATAEVLFDFQGSKQVFPGISMVLPLGTQPWPEGLIDLRGIPW